MKIKIIGYGTLLCKKNWELILNRKVEDKDCEIIKLNNYKRTWSAFSKIVCNSTIMTGCFLNLSYDKKSFINGFAVTISEEEFNKFKIEKKGYKLIEVTSHIENNDENNIYYASIFKENFYPTKNTVIMRGYLLAIDTALSNLDIEQRRIYIQTTDMPNFNIKNGSYRFLDDIDNNKILNKIK